MLPSSNTSGEISFVDALFTSTSAICVTGLIVKDTPKDFTLVGQIIILVLLQLGGLGIMTFSTLILFAAGRKISITDRILVQEGYHPGVSWDFRSLIKNIFIFTFIIEFSGFVLLFLRFREGSDLLGALYSALFHSVSSFCNAGFSVYSDSLMSYRGDVLVNITVISLIILGGLGFLVIREVLRASRGLLRGAKVQLSLHSKLVLSLTVVLIIGSFILFLLLEGHGAMKDFTLKEKILASLFQVVTPRTAGFNTMDLTALGPASVLLLIMLMFVGASPGSTGGGVKTSTFGVVLAFVRSRIAARESVHLFFRNIPQENIVRAFTLIALSMNLIFFSSLIIFINQPQLLMRDVFFEVFSSFGTVGLSLGIAPHLSAVSKTMIIVTMYAGRIGPLTLLYAFSRRRALGKFEYVEERVMIG